MNHLCPSVKWWAEGFRFGEAGLAGVRYGTVRSGEVGFGEVWRGMVR